MNFEELNLHPKILKTVAAAGYTEPTPIQEQAIPVILAGKDVQASASTGTGKSAAFLLPSIHKLAQSEQTRGKAPRVLVIVPTRELAMQIQTEANKYCKQFPEIRTASIYGGVPYNVDRRILSRPFDILIATPGRLIDHLDQGKINLSKIEVLILDEADRLLDMGFIDPVKKIASLTPSTRQTLLFSATLKGNVLNLSKCLLKSPVEIAIKPKVEQVTLIEQRLHYADNMNHKLALLDHVLSDENLTHAIIFTATKQLADDLADNLYNQGHRAKALHGDMSQRHRTTATNQFKEGKINVLVATDVASRGLHIDSVSHVINFDLPRNVEDYVHRIGRTGRAGANGIALSLVSHKDERMVSQIERFTGQKITPHVIKGMEPKLKPERKKDSFSKRPQRRFGQKKPFSHSKSKARV